MRDVLVERMGFPEENITLLLDDGEEATEETMPTKANIEVGKQGITKFVWLALVSAYFQAISLKSQSRYHKCCESCSSTHHKHSFLGRCLSQSFSPFTIGNWARRYVSALLLFLLLPSSNHGHY
jgi:hypothetical protein